MYKELLDEFTCNPRDIHTVPLHSKPYKWFHVFVEKNNLYVESAHSNTPKCSVKKRMLPKDECNDILAIYHRRLSGEQVSAEAQECTRSQVYWYGIFSEMKL